MRRVAAALALVLVAAGCGTSPCQELGEKLCACTGATTDTCKTQVEQQLKAIHLTEGRCGDILGACVAPAGTDFCEWLLTAQGQEQCGLAPTPSQ